MHPILRIGLTALVFASTALQAQETPSYTLRSDGIERSYKLHLPDDLPDDAPLVVVLHGYGGTNDPARFGMNATADRHGFAVCYPQGEKDSRGKSGWCVGYPSQHNMSTKKDIRFLHRLIRRLQKEHGLSRRNVFLTGMSNGGDMCYLLVSECPRLFAAYAPVAGFMSVETYLTDRCVRPVPLFEIHGTADQVTFWEGDAKNEGGWGAYVSIPLAVQYMVVRNRCTEYRSERLPLQSPDALQVIAHRYSNGRDDCDVWLYEVVGGTHSWDRTGVDTCEEIWRFFRKYVR